MQSSLVAACTRSTRNAEMKWHKESFVPDPEIRCDDVS